jgi:hypothetical protein
MDKGSIEILKENLYEVNLSLSRLMYSFEKCSAISLKDVYSDEEFEAFEAMTARYARTTDMLVNKVLRSLDAVEYIDGGTVIDATNNTEKRGIADAQDLRELKDLRNLIAHEYVTEKIVRFFDKVLAFTPLLKKVIEKLNEYCSRYINEEGEKRYGFSVYSAHGDHKVIFEQENDITEAFYNQLLLLFSDVDYEKKIINFSCLHQMKDDIKNNISKFARNFEKNNIQVRKIEKWFEEIQYGEFFYVFPETEFPPEYILYIFGCIELLNKGVPYENLEKEMEEQYAQQKILFSDLFGKYEIMAYNPRKKFTYGNLDKKSRVCKYCGKSMVDGATFHNEAHAIPESLGNKTIISADECDTCNDFFSKTIDKDIFEYLKLYRTLYGKKGKMGIPELKFKNGTVITHDGEKAIILQQVHGNEDKIDFTKDSFKIPLEFINKINFMNIYRSLVKYVFAIIPNDEIINFPETIKWIMNIKNNGDILDLPSVAMKIDILNYYEQPMLMVYKRKTDDVSLPYMYAELRITNFIFVYIIPFSNKDTIIFGEDKNFEYFWQFNKHYARVKDWVFNKFNLDLAKETVLNMQMSKR